MRRSVLLFILLGCVVRGQDSRYRPEGQLIPGPPNAGEFSAWLGEVKQWRAERLQRMGYDGAEYARAEVRWTQRNFVQPQMMAEERYFYDPAAGRYTVDRYLDDLEKRYGGIDSVLIWPVYPNIGIDNRNQFDCLRDLPGGVEGLRKMVADFHRRGVRVFFPNMAWDQGTREEGRPLWTAMAGLLREIGADGINGDTYYGLPRAFLTASLEAGHPLAIEPENGVEADEMLAWNQQSWGYWKYSFVPGVSRYKWLEPRHMVNVCRRWARDKTDDLQHAFFNGVGYESWENIWGIWNGITPRDGEALRRIARIERSFAELLVSEAWEPHTPMVQQGVFASKFPGAGRTLWTVVNRNEYDVAGQQMRVPHAEGMRYFDVWHGVELRPRIEGGTARLSFEVEGRGYGAVVAARELGLDAFRGGEKRLAEFNGEWKFLPQRLVEMAPTARRQEAPAGMVRIPGGEFDFRVSGVMIEGANDVGTGVQYAWEDSPRRHHRRMIDVKTFFMDRYPVTNAEFKKFLDATRYRPGDDHNFLRDWVGGSYPEGWEKKPVTWVSMEDARAYAKWAGKRLPHEWEWQYAAQGGDGRAYPWGNQWDAEAVPPADHGRAMRAPTAVDAFPKGASPFGVMDLTGNVWQWTDEYVDEHTRAAILRGGSYYQPRGSHWYFPQAYKLTEHGKYLLMAPSKDRSRAVGFRCAADAE